MVVLFTKKSLAIGGVIAVIAVLFFAFGRKRTEYVVVDRTPENAALQISTALPAMSADAASSIEASASSAPVNPLTGERCNNALRRPVAVMFSGDTVARPLSGIGEADMVFEMPVITGSITRFMGVFICRDPIEMGSVRSARHDFIPLARSLDALYAHWGGSHFALDLLKKGSIDNIDAITNPVNAYWRKEGAVAPHNGFTSMSRLLKAARFLQYRLEGRAPAYPHVESVTSAAHIARGILEVGYPGEFRVRYEYDPATRFYTRIRGGITERDKNSGQALQVRNIAVMRAVSRQIERDYNDVVLEGNGDVSVYRGGEEVNGTWHKDSKDDASKLIFMDKDGNEIPFLPGNIWVHIAEPYTNSAWQAE